MDWFSWLSKTSLEPTMVYEYAQAFVQNELEEEDIAYFNHEILQSMGIVIAKHRLEILKLARREGKGINHPISKLLLVFKRTKQSLTRYMSRLVHKKDDDDGRALIVLPNNDNKMKKRKKNKSGAISYSSRWRKTMMIRNNKKLIMMNGNNNQENFRLTNGDYFGDFGDDCLIVSSPKLDSFSNPLMYDIHQNKEKKDVDDDHDDDHWTPSIEEIKWDAMFQDLKPT